MSRCSRGRGRAYEEEQQARANAVESRDELVNDARSQAYAEGQASREAEVAAAVKHVDGLTAEQDVLRTRLETDVAEAREAGRADRDVEVRRLTDAIPQLQADLTAMTEARDQHAEELRLVDEPAEERAGCEATICRGSLNGTGLSQSRSRS